MRRVQELVDAVREAHPTDSFFADFEASIETVLSKRHHYAVYERAFSGLDCSSWRNLLDKAVAHFHEERPRRRKRAFFDQLNDAFAYRWLANQGFAEIEVLAEQRGKQAREKCPDIRFRSGREQFYCDVKTIENSEDELERRFSPPRYHDRSEYALLHPTFFKKIDEAIAKGTEQILARGKHGLVFILVHSDSFTINHYRQHRTQIVRHLRHPLEIALVVKFGIFGLRRIERGSPWSVLSSIA